MEQLVLPTRSKQVSMARTLWMYLCWKSLTLSLDTLKPEDLIKEAIEESRCTITVTGENFCQQKWYDFGGFFSWKVAFGFDVVPGINAILVA